MNPTNFHRLCGEARSNSPEPLSRPLRQRVRPWPPREPAPAHRQGPAGSIGLCRSRHGLARRSTPLGLRLQPHSLGPIREGLSHIQSDRSHIRRTSCPDRRQVTRRPGHCDATSGHNPVGPATAPLWQRRQPAGLCAAHEVGTLHDNCAHRKPSLGDDLWDQQARQVDRSSKFCDVARQPCGVNIPLPPGQIHAHVGGNGSGGR